MTSESEESPSGSLGVTHIVLTILAVVAIGWIAVAGNPHYFWRDDMQTQHVPSGLEIGTALLGGEWPLLSNYSWFAAAFAGEFQYGVFSPFLLACNVVIAAFSWPLHIVAAFLVVAHLCVTAVGASLLARSHGLSRWLVALVAAVAVFNGWLIHWGATSWLPALTTFAWLPWYWYGLRRLFLREVGAGPLLITAVSLQLLVAAGWPFTVLMAVLVAAWHVAAATLSRKWRAIVWMAGASAAGLALAGPAIVGLLEYLPSTTREGIDRGHTTEWTIPFVAWSGLALPTMRTEWWRAWHPTHAAMELTGGLVPVAAIVAALSTVARRYLVRARFELSLTVAAGLLAMSPALPLFRWSFRWLPLFFLALALAGAKALAELSAEPADKRVTRLPAVWAILMLGVATALAVSAGAYDVLTREYAQVMAAAVAIWWIAQWKRPRLAFPLATVVCFVSIAYAYLQIPVNDSTVAWKMNDSLRKPWPHERGRRHLAIYRWPELFNPARAWNPAFRPGNTPQIAALEYVNGYSPMRPAGMNAVLGFWFIHGSTEREAAPRVYRREMQSGALLDHLRVDSVIVPTSMVAEYGIPAGWSGALLGNEVLFRKPPLPGRDAYLAAQAVVDPTPEAAENRILRRRVAAHPVIVVEPDAKQPRLATYCATARLTDVDRKRHHSTAMVDTTSCTTESLIVFPRPWFPGFRARIDGAAVPLLVADLIMPAVRVPARTKGEVRIEYRPRAVSAGAPIAAAGAAALLAAAMVSARRPRGSAPA